MDFPSLLCGIQARRGYGIARRGRLDFSALLRLIEASPAAIQSHCAE